jgi:phosphate-selective porin
MNVNLTGESLNYKDGLFEFLKVRKPFGKSNGYGAFSLTFRFVQYDLWMPRQECKEYAAGLHWAPTNNTRLSLQYSHLDHKPIVATGTADDSGEGNLVSLKWKLFF